MLPHNYLKANSRKSDIIVAIDNKLTISVKGSLVSNKKIIKLLGVTVDNKLSFEAHLNLVRKKVNQKVYDLSKYISNTRLRVIMKAFIMSQFSYRS